MLISEAMNRKLNEQITNEMNASQKYLAMACCFERMGLKVFARRFLEQANEERGHALKIMKYVVEVGGAPLIDAVSKPQGDYDSARAMVEAALHSELTVTKQIYDLVALAEQERDYATRSFMNWFVDEQVEEVSSMEELLQLVRMAGDAYIFQLEGRLMAMMKAES